MGDIHADVEAFGNHVHDFKQATYGLEESVNKFNVCIDRMEEIVKKLVAALDRMEGQGSTH